MSRKRILLFDWAAPGHGELYVRKLAKTLSRHEVIVAVPDSLAERIADAPVKIVPLGPAPPANEGVAPRAERRRARKSETKLLGRVIARVNPDRVLHLYGDRVLPELARAPTFGTPVALLLFRPRAHYPKAFGAPLTPRERGAAAVLEISLAGWRRRRDALAVGTLDAYAARRWQRSRAAPAFWFPEPPVAVPTEGVVTTRRGAIVTGALSQRKGIASLAAAVRLRPRMSVVLAGRVYPSYLEQFERLVAEMRGCGAEVDVRNRLLTEHEFVVALASAHCAVLPYPRHVGMSRVLLEAAAAGTPVVADSWGLLGHLVREHGLGLTCRSADPRELASALGSVLDDERAPERYAENLRRFADLYSEESFRRSVGAILNV